MATIKQIPFLYVTTITHQYISVHLKYVKIKLSNQTKKGIYYLCFFNVKYWLYENKNRYIFNRKLKRYTIVFIYCYNLVACYTGIYSNTRINVCLIICFII